MADVDFVRTSLRNRTQVPDPQIRKKTSLGRVWVSQKNIDKNVAFRANLSASLVFSQGVSQMRRRHACAVLPESCHLFYAPRLLLRQLQIPHLRRRFLAVKRTHAPFANAAHGTTAIPPQMTKIIVAATCCSGRLARTRTAPACKTKLCLSLGSPCEGRRDSSSRPRNHRGSDPDSC